MKMLTADVLPPDFSHLFLRYVRFTTNQLLFSGVGGTEVPPWPATISTSKTAPS